MIFPINWRISRQEGPTVSRANHSLCGVYGLTKSLSLAVELSFQRSTANVFPIVRTLETNLRCSLISPIHCGFQI